MRKWLSLIEMYRVLPGDVKKRASGVRLSGGGNRMRSGLHPLGGVLVVLSLTLCLAHPRTALAQCEPLRRAASPATSASPRSLSCQFDLALTRTFTPATVVAKDTYRAYVTDAPIDEVVAAFRSVANSESVRGAWAIEQIEALDAFGKAGQYDATRVSRLYGGRRARVAHGPIVRNGRTVTSITLVSPYPDPSLAHLERGTLIIEYRVAVNSE